MPIEKISFLTPDEQLKESEVLMNFFDLVISERKRYEIQAKELLEKKKLEVQSDSKVIKYQERTDCFTYNISLKPGSLENYSSQIPIPENDLDKIEALVEFFARSEAGVIT
jgi:hypothetical protein